MAHYGGKDQEIGVRSHLGQNVSKTSSQPISQEWWHVPVIPAVREAIGKKITVRG
jgi:D-alanyl-D-alanine dipeptidase